MNTIRFIFIPLLMLVFCSSCENNQEIDREKPTIDISIPDAFPVNCDTIYFGESFELKVLFSDNAELGSYSLEIHHNFDHHSHSTEIEVCVLDPLKTPVNPYHTIQDYEIPAGSKEYTVNREVSLPRSDGNGDFDEGDYHFFISLTDREGWSAQTGLNIKILKRE